jgi:hypothetical protein
MAELFEVDLENDTLTRVTHGYEGAPSERPHKETNSGERPYRKSTDGVLSPSFSADGGLLAFSSSASNLVYGDGNTPVTEAGTGSADGTDVFSVGRVKYVPAPIEGYVSPAPPNPTVAPEWRLGVTERSLPDGRVLLYVTVPAAGALSAVAQSALLISRAARVHHARAHRARRRTVVATRSVASASKASTPTADGLQQLVLALTPHYRALASRPGGLSANVTVTFSALGEPRLSQSLAVSFVRHTKPAAHRRARRARRRRR